ncbi:MAG: ribonuclease E/G [Lachnospiraceae bacterium]|nr:ribonuclease E/G [Lachnospiraceae bacterium]
MNKRIITLYRDGILTAVRENDRFIRFDWEKSESESLIGNIYVGRVNKVVPGIQAAFVDVGDGLTGYYSLTDNKTHIYLSSGKHDRLKEGDLILVQVERDPVKTKMMMLTGRLNLTGRYVALTCGRPGLSFSSRLKVGQYKELKEQIREVLSDFPSDEYALIVRTNAMAVTADVVRDEAFSLLDRLTTIRAEANYRKSGSLMFAVSPAWLQEIRDSRDDELDEIVTDNAQLFEQLSEFVEKNCPTLKERLRLYTDDYSLHKLYSLETELERALSERVWLKSGGFLVIQPTEAMTVIDVNTGKFTGKKNAEETFLKLNLEAAKEIALQIRLRNLSGIIIVDFIDMKTEESRQELMSYLDSLLSADQIKTTLVDMTKLGLVEITRKKVRRTLAEKLR